MSSCSAADQQKPKIGVTWRSNQESETYVAVIDAIKAAGGEPVLLEQLLSPDLSYDNDKMLTEGKDEFGVLTKEAAETVRAHGWQGSDASAVIEELDGIVFTGGEDISPNLYYDPQPMEVNESYSAERDVSDYILMSCCLDNDIPVLAICRGMQVLSVVSDAEMIQDIPAYLESLGLPSNYEHRSKPAAPGESRDFARHDVTVTEQDSLLYEIVGRDVIEDVPSWHHQAVKSVEGTKLKVTGVTETSGIDIIEAVERTDKTFVLGLQFHPEIDVVRGQTETSIFYFKAIVEAAR